MKKNSLIALAIGAVAAVLFFASLAGYAYPGDSARLIALWKGLDVGACEYPLMAAFAKLLGGGNLIAPICGALAAMALYGLVSAFVAARVRADETLPQKNLLATLAGAVAAVVFVLTPAVRSAATHLEPRLFDFLWALVTLLVAVPFFGWRKGAVWGLAPLMGVLCGLAFCDSALVLAFLPFYLATLTCAALKQGRKPYLALFLFLFVGFLTALFAAGWFGLALGDHLGGLAREMKAWYKTPGWLFVALFATLPFVTSLFSSQKAFNEPPTLVPWLFHAAMTFAAILAVATPLAPSTVMEPYGILPVASSAFAACVAGYLVAFWWLYRRRVVALVAGGVLAFVLVVSCLWNLFAFDGDRGAFADRIARKVVQDLGDRTWFVSDGVLDNHLKLVAAEAGRPLHVISLARDQDEDYLARLGELVAQEGVGGEKNAELRTTLTLGVLPFLQDWFAADPSVAQKVAIWGAPDLWYAANKTPVPEFLFFGADEAHVPDWTAWKEFDAILEAPKGWGSYHAGTVPNPVDRLRFSLRRHLGFVANNRGVWLQDKHRDDDAWKMYELVLNEIDRDNICAVFNEVAMIGANHPSAVAKKRELERTLKAAVDDAKRRYVLWRLGTYYGYIRNPDVFVRLGHAWAKSGRPGDALSQIRRAIDFVPSDKRSSLLNMMAALYANENDQKKSRRIYEGVLEKNERDHDALLGLMRLELLDGNAAKALEYLERAAAVAGDDKRAQLEFAMVSMMKNDLTEAAEHVQKAIDKDGKDLQAWSLFAAVTMQQIDAAKDPKAKAALEKRLNDVILPTMEKQATDPYDYHVQTTKGFALLKKGEAGRKEARDAFAAAAKARPGIPATQDLVLGLDISLDDKENAEQHARDVLRRNRNAPLANYVMGSLAFGRGNLAEAETFLRKAANAPQPVALALNDLAEVLRRTQRLVEAETYARKAVKAAPGLYVAWETLGSILMDQNRDFAEAESCIRKACELSKGPNGREADVRMLVSLARVQLKAGDKQHAKVTIRKVQSRLGELSDFEKREFEDVKKLAK